MCTVRRSSSYRPFAWMATVLALFVFALAPAGWAAVDIVDAGGGLEGDPGDGHNFTGGGGSSIDDIGGEKSIENPVMSWPVFIHRFMPVIVFDGNRISITVIRVVTPSVGKCAEGGE